MAQFAQKADGCSIPGNIWCSSEQPALVGDVPACGGRLDRINLNGPFQTIL